MNKHQQTDSSRCPQHRLISISDTANRTELLRRTADVLKIEFPHNYVQRSTCYGFFDANDTLCGGALLATHGPYRSLDAIPEHARESSHWVWDDRGRLAEVNGVWLSSHQKSPFTSLAFWTLLFNEFLKCGRQKFLFTYDNANQRMASLMKWTKPEILYSGPTRILPGMERVTDETIAVGDRESIALFLDVLSRRGQSKPSTYEQDLIDRLPKQSKPKTNP